MGYLGKGREHGGLRTAQKYFTITLVKPTFVYLSGIIMLWTNMFQDGPREEGDARRFG